VRQSPALTADQLEMAKGPDTCIKKYYRAEIKGVKFCSSELEGHKKARDSIIMIDSEVAECGKEFGMINRFYEINNPPGSSIDTSYVADVKWYKAAPSGQGMNKQIQCPVVSKLFQSDPLGNFWDLTAIVPTNIMMVPHLKRRTDFWQVLHVDSDFMKRKY